MIHQTIKEQLKDAMRAKDTLLLSTIRGLLTAFTNEMIAKGVNDEFLTDEQVITIIKRQVKQRNEAIEQFTKGGRNDLADKEKLELEILKKYLPEEMSEGDIKVIAEKKKAELNVTDKTKLGVLVGVVMKETKGKADGSVVKKIVEALFV